MSTTPTLGRRLLRRIAALGSTTLPLAALGLLAACQTLPSASPERPAPAQSTAPQATARAAAPADAAPSPQEQRVIAAVDNENSVFFATGASELDAAARQRLQRHAQRLLGDGRLTVTLTGHSDDQGSPAFNLALAEQRINAVFAALREQGVPARQMRRYALGQEKVPAVCKTTECRRRMRRVDLVYPDGKGDLPSLRLSVDHDGAPGNAR